MTADLASLGFAIDTRPLYDAGTAMSQMGEEAERSEQSVLGLQSASDRMVGALRTNTSALASTGTAYSALAGEINRLSTAVDQFATRAPRVNKPLDEQAEALRRATAQWRAYGEAGRTALDRIEQNRRISGMFGGLSSDGSVAQRPAPGSASARPDATNDNSKAKAFQLQNLAFQGGDVIASLGSGGGLGRIALQQGPQVAQSFMGPGALTGADLTGAATGLASRAAGFAMSAGGAATGVAGVFAAAIAAQQSYSASQIEVVRSLSGVGRASGETAASINVMAASISTASGVSQREARSIASAYAGTGKIGGDAMIGLTRVTKDFAASTGQDLGDASSELAKAFADPAKGAEMLTERFGALSDSQKQAAEDFAAQGNRIAAHRVLMDGLGTSITKATELTSGWGRITTAVGNVVSNAWDATGKAVDKVITGGSLDDKIQTAEKQLFRVQQSRGRLFGLSGADADARERAIRDGLTPLYQERDERSRLATRTQANLNSIDIGNLRRALDPAGEQLRTMTNQAEKLRTAISDPIRFGLDASALGATEAAFQRISALASQARQDAQQWGTSETAGAVRAAEAQARTAGMSSGGQSAASIEQLYQEKLIAKGLNTGVETRDQINARFADRLNDPNADARALSDVAKQRDELMKRTAEIEGLQRERDLKFQGLNTQTAVGANQSSGLLGRLPEQYRGTAVAAANRYGVPLDFYLGVMGNESDFKVGADASRNFSNSRAYGLMQLQPGTARDLGVDPRDPVQNMMGGADYLGQAYRRANGNLSEAYRLYHDGLGSRKPMSDEARGGFARIQQLMGAPTDAANISATTERNRALKDEAEALRLTREAGGRDAEGLRARIDLMQAQSRETAKGNILTAETTAHLAAEGRERQRLATGQRLTDYGYSSAFDRDQLGRNSGEAAAYARARSVVGDTNSDAAQGIIATEQMTSGFRELKSMAGGALTGFLTDMRQGVGLMSSMSSLTGRLADRFLSMASDRVISGLLGGLMGDSKSGGSGLIGSIASAIGGGALPKFAEGGITSGPSIAGEIPGRNEAVIPLSNNRFVPVQINQPPANTNMPAPVFQQEVHNYAGVPVETQDVTDGRGQRKQVMIIGDMVATGSRTPQAQRAMSAPMAVAR